MDFNLVKKNSGYKIFEQDVKNGNVSHAYIVYSEDSELRKTFCKLCCIQLLCPTACGECNTCRQILEGNYVEISNFDGKDLKVSGNNANSSFLDDLIEQIDIKPIVGDKKIIIIDNFNLASATVQNKLLKTLEEPPSYLTFLLSAAQENGVLTTIKSRCKKIYLESLLSEDIVNELVSDGTDRTTAETAAAIAMGNYSKALAFTLDEDYNEAYNETFEMLLKLQRSSQITKILYEKVLDEETKTLFDKDTIEHTFDFMELILLDVLKITSNSSIPLNIVNRTADLEAIAVNYTTTSAAMSILAINEGRKKLKSNQTAQVVATNVLMNILEARYKWRKK